jgi:two-component system, cell cycle sensor histidine kinase and response regulator CckA
MPKTVLIVDDDAAMTDNLEDILGDEGYSILSAGTCSQALALAAAQKPQVALLDLKLPDDTGINLLAELKRMYPQCVCALITAYADVESAISALEKGAFHYLQKPVRPMELINLLERIFETIQIREDKRLAEDRLKESEQRFRTIVESAQDAIFLKDCDLRYTLVNPVMETLFGLQAESFIGRSDQQLFHQKDTVRTARTDQRVLNGEIVEQEEIRRVAGIKKILHSIKVPMRDSTGRITGLCGFTRDLTGTRTLEAQLLRAQKMEAIGTLAGGISHDFNNLLQGILGYTQILILGRKTSDAELVKLREIERAAKRASELTARLLAFSRKVEIHLRPVNLNPVVQQVKKLLERTIPKMIDIQLRLADGLHTINADTGQLEQVILNIGLNARDAMPEGGILKIETSNVHVDECMPAFIQNDRVCDYVLLSISDTGHGMTQEVREHIFEPFFTTKRMGQGTGLGMAMAYGIIQNHHGHIACESQAGVGTQFKIYLPSVKMKGEVIIEEPEAPLHCGQGETLLVVDDELFIRELARDMLSMNGYQVLTAESGEAGLALYQQHRSSIALVILDLIMPGKGGKQCMTDMLKIDPHAKILIASGFAIQEPPENTVLSQALGFIQKPYNFKKMLQLIREIILRDIHQ